MYWRRDEQVTCLSRARRKHAGMEGQASGQGEAPPAAERSGEIRTRAPRARGRGLRDRRGRAEHDARPRVESAPRRAVAAASRRFKEEHSVNALDERTTQEMLDDHLRLARELKLEEDLGATSRRTATSSPDVASTAGTTASGSSPTPSCARSRRVSGAMCCDWWGAHGVPRIARGAGPARVPDGADSFLIEDGKIQAQTIHYTVVDADGGCRRRGRDRCRRCGRDGVSTAGRRTAPPLRRGGRG
jgi:hypothetical protein